MDLISERLQAIRQHMFQAALDAGRDPEAIALLAVSKAQPASALRRAYAAGQRRFGENYLQEALDKMSALADLPLEWHFIGPIQSNKTRPIAEHFSWAHGVERLKIAERLNESRPPHLPPLQVCLQINVSGEAGKSGIAPEEAEALAPAVAALPRIRLRGLMAIPAPTQDIAQQRAAFRRVSAVLETLKRQGLPLDTLSMGMSEDFPAAIAEGATLVRVGAAIFGPRPRRIIEETP